MLRISGILVFISIPLFGQQNTAAAGNGQPSKHILGIIPNFRTTPILKEYKPLSTKQKFTIATQDSFDRGTVALATFFAGEGQLIGKNPSFGQGAEGYAHRWATTYADYLVGNFMTEAIFPSLLHQDPRYFRRGAGSPWSRLGYAVSQVVWTRGDSGKGQVNFSEILGNSTAAAISTSYYPDGRNASGAASSLAVQLGIDAASNILKEFWPVKMSPPKPDPANATPRQSPD
ncbi:MAG: hypothetical protein KGN84_01380 [Acidobacteriota bacterium]|nr:hypothetical protein [Acidobacteriota bacterium]